jgi:type IV pilus assembly protein PilM
MIFSKLFSSKRFLGIDIGTAGIRLVELSGRKEKKKLENYAEMKAEVAQKNPFRTFEKNALLLSGQDIAQAIKATMKEAGIKTRDCIFSIPDFSTFFTDFELPSMPKEEIGRAVNYEARQHIPLPLSEVTLDWEVIEGRVSNRGKSKLKILLVAVPNETINQYQTIAKLCNLQALALEAEVFGLLRSLIPANENRTIAIIDIGDQTTTCSIIDKRVLISSNSFNLSGDDLTERLIKSLAVDYPTAQKLKEEYGLKEIPSSPADVGSLSKKNIKEILLPLVGAILEEVEKISLNFYQTGNKEVQKFIIAGGTSLMPGLKECFENYLKKETEIADPFSEIFCPSILKETLKEMGPAYAIALGMALRGFEQA